jgi:Family of unknown function (DUF6086)
MSYVFEIDTETVWSPALRVGEIYVGFVRVLEEIVGSSAGLEPISSDMVRIDPERLKGFVRDLLSVTTTHVILGSELETVIALSLVMLERGGADLVIDERDAAIGERAKALAVAMPT